MDFLRNSRYSTRLAALILVFLASFSIYGLYCINTVTAVKINGTFYQRIIQGKDVIADVLPPPAYLIETYLTAFQMLEADTSGLPRLEARMATLRAEYLARQEHWRQALDEGPLKRLLVEESFQAGMRLLGSLETGYIPALRAGDRARAKALLAGEIEPAYAAHRAAIDKVVELALERHRQDEASAAMAVESRTYGQIALGVALFFSLTMVSAYVLQKSDSGPAAGPGPAPEAQPPRPAAAPLREPDLRLKSRPDQFRESV